MACINISTLIDQYPLIYYKHNPVEILSDFENDKLYPGLEVLFVGYPDNRYDTHNNLPLLRKGYIASMPKVDFNNKKEFVIDAQVFPGSSGSPVYAAIDNSYRMIGVVSHTMIKYGQVQTFPTASSYGVQQILGLGIVIKSTRLRELLQFTVNKFEMRL